MQAGRGLSLQVQLVEQPRKPASLSCSTNSQGYDDVAVAGWQGSQFGELEPAFLEIGSPSWARTSDPLINSQLLYQLSYRGIEWRV